METLGEMVKKIRTSAGLSQGQFAQEIGVTLNMVWRWETQGAIPTIANIVKVNNFATPEQRIKLQAIIGLEVQGEGVCGSS